MTDNNKTLIAALLDRSGSMQSCKKATEDGFNELIKSQRFERGEALVTLCQFNEEYERVYTNRKISTVPKLSLDPDGMTALYESIGSMIDEIGASLKDMAESERPGKVICLIMTDGRENASGPEWRDASKVRKMIKIQECEYNWEFIFLGANIDAEKEGQNIGINLRNAMTYNSHDDNAVRGVYASASASISNMRAGNNAGFSDDDRKLAMGKQDKSVGAGNKWALGGSKK